MREGSSTPVSIPALGFEFQPIYDLQARAAVGLEALARWPGRSPDSVFADARDEGIVVDLDREVTYAAVDHLTDIPEHLYLSVNVTPEGLVGNPLVRALAMPDDQRRRLIVELVEQTDAPMFEMYDKLRHLRSLGIRYAVDDVGVGHGNVFRVAQLLPDVVKIDQSLIHGLGIYVVNRAVVRAIVAMANELRCDVVAEGVENRDDLLWAASLGVRYAQGYHLCRPMPLTAALTHLTLT